MKAILSALSGLSLPVLFGAVFLFSIGILLLALIFGPALLLLILLISFGGLALWLIGRDFGGIAALFRLLRLALFFARQLPRLAPALRITADGLDEASRGLRQATAALQTVNAKLVDAGHQIASFELPKFEPDMKTFEIPTGLHSSEKIDLVVGMKISPSGVQPLSAVGTIVDAEAGAVGGAVTAVATATLEIDDVAVVLRRIADALDPATA